MSPKLGKDLLGGQLMDFGLFMSLAPALFLMAGGTNQPRPFPFSWVMSRILGQIIGSFQLQDVFPGFSVR